MAHDFAAHPAHIALGMCVAQQDQERQWHQQQQWWWCGGSKQQQAFGPLCQASIEKFLGNSSLSLIAVRPLPVEVQGLLLQLSELLNCTMGYILHSIVYVPFLKIPAFERLFFNFIFLYRLLGPQGLLGGLQGPV